MLAFGFYAWLWPGAPYLAGDTGPYLQVARDLKDFDLDDFHVRSVGYPWLLRLTGSLEQPTRGLFFVQLAMYLVCIVLLVMLLRRAQVAHALQWLFVGLMLLPYNVMPAARALTETFSQFLLVLGLVCLLLGLQKRWLWALVLAGLSFAFLALVRPTYQLLGVLVALLLVFLAWRLPSWRRVLLWGAAALGLASAVLIGSVAWHNLRAHGFAGVTPLFGLHLTQKTGRVVELLPETDPARAVLLTYRDQSLLSADNLHQFYNYIWKIPIEELRPDPEVSYAQLSGQYLRRNLYLIAQSPLIYLQEVGYSLVNLTLPVSNSLSHGSSPVLQALWTLIHFGTLGLCLLTGVGVIGIGLWSLAASARRRLTWWQSWPVEQRWLWIGLLAAFALIAYNLLLTALVEMGDPRTRLSSEPLLVWAACVGLDSWRRARLRLR
jgi:hypothetical protein